MIIRARGFFLLMILLSFQHAIFGAEELKDGLYAKLETSRGEILLQLYHQRVPQTVANFVGLAEATKAWNDCRFHDPGGRSSGNRKRRSGVPFSG